MQYFGGMTHPQRQKSACEEKVLGRSDEESAHTVKSDSSHDGNTVSLR
jgi:hypothetical protein